MQAFDDLDRAIFQLQFMSQMMDCGRHDAADAAYDRVMATLRRMRDERDAYEEAEAEELARRAEEEEPGSARWRAERRWLAAADADELDLY